MARKKEQPGVSSNEEIERVFDKHDANKDGELTLDEFAKAILECTS